jgi:hypothetical protein
MEIERFVQKILDTENLTDELEDSDASWLLDWGIGQLAVVLQDETDAEAAGAKTNCLMAVMRKMNRIGGLYARKAPSDLAEDLAQLDELMAQAFPSGEAPADFDPAVQEDREITAAQFANQSPRQVIESLANRRINRPPTPGPLQTA